MRAIVYNSNTGFSERYAKMLSKATGVRAYSVEEAKKELPKDAPIVYVCWVMGNLLVGASKISRRFYIRAVAAVGLNQGPHAEGAIRAQSGLPDSIPLFLLPGGLKLEKLNVFHRLLLKMVESETVKQIQKSVRPTDDSLEFLEQLRNGCDLVDEAHLEDLIDWVKNWKEKKK